MNVMTSAIRIIILLSVSVLVFGQDKDAIHVRRHTPNLDSLAVFYKAGFGYIDGKHFVSENSYEPFQSLFQYRPNNKSISYIFRNCILNDTLSGYISPGEQTGITDLGFQRCNIKSLYLKKLSGRLQFESNRVKAVEIDSSSDLSIRLHNNRSDQFNISNSTGLRLEFESKNNHSTTTQEIRKSRITLLRFALSDSSGHHFYKFTNDTIVNFEFLRGRLSDAGYVISTTNAHTLIFRNCHFERQWEFKARPPGTTVKFVNCTFAPGVNITGMRLDAIVLDNLTSLTVPVKVSFANDSCYQFISLINADLAMLDIEWKSKTYIYFDSIQREDINNNTIEALMDKYKREQKSASYKQADLMYHFYNESDIFWNWDKYWWGHGYQKKWVFLWALAMLTVFSMINLWCWNKMQNVYTLFPASVTFPIKKTLAKNFFSAFIYTCFIFFSLTVKLERLKLSFRWLVCWFFIQYVAGLLCLLFIVKAILKW